MIWLSIISFFWVSPAWSSMMDMTTLDAMLNPLAHSITHNVTHDLQKASALIPHAPTIYSSVRHPTLQLILKKFHKSVPLILKKHGEKLMRHPSKSLKTHGLSLARVESLLALRDLQVHLFDLTHHHVPVSLMKR